MKSVLKKITENVSLAVVVIALYYATVFPLYPGRHGGPKAPPSAQQERQ